MLHLRRLTLALQAVLLPALVALALATTARATPETASAPGPAQDLAPPETVRQALREAAEWVARGVDGWFGDKPFEQGGQVSDARLTLGLFKRQDQRADVDLRFNAHFRLPNVEHQAYLFIGRDDRRDAIRDTPGDLQRQQLLAPGPVERSLLGGLGLTLLDTFEFRLGLGGGLRPYLQARYDRPWLVAEGQRLDFRETLFWTRADRLGATTVLTYERLLGRTLSFRWQTAATLTRAQRRVDWSSNLGLYRALDGQRRLGLELLLSGQGTWGRRMGSPEPGLLVKWEQPIHHDWLFAEIVGGHFWPRPSPARRHAQAWALGANLKVLF